MGTLTERMSDYFASLSPLANRIIQETNLVKKRHGDEWNNLSIDQQVEIIDSHFIDPDIKSTYPQKEDAPECYPKLKINCGENIVADFDGSMWRDEHSGPFSWYSLSQQDLTIPDPVEFEEGEENNANEVSPKKGKGKKKKKKVKKGNAGASTDDAICAEENSTEPQPDTAETKDGDRLNPETLNQSGSLNTSVSLSPSKMSALKIQVKTEEETKLLDSSFESGTDNDPAKSEIKQPVKPKKKKIKVPRAAPPPPPVDKRWKKEDKQANDIQETLIIAPPTAKPLKLVQDSEGGMVSGVFIHEVGESSTDPDTTITTQPKASLAQDLSAIGGQEVIVPEPAQEVGAVGGQINLALDEEESAPPANSEQTDEKPKDGFDFLLDW